MNVSTLLVVPNVGAAFFLYRFFLLPLQRDVFFSIDFFHLFFPPIAKYIHLFPAGRGSQVAIDVDEGQGPAAEMGILFMYFSLLIPDRDSANG